jgi:hypothetical protein
MGYGPDELPMISQASTAGVTSIPSDLAPNLSALSAARVSGPLAQKPLTEPATQQKHYVSFVISDGDNVAWNLWGLQKYLTGPARGSFNVGYGVSPSMADLAPAALDWYYRNALTGPVAEEFIAGPSGTGYTFPSRMTPADLDRYTENLDALMGRAGLGICEILDDQHVIKRDDLWHSYLTRPNIDALLYFGPGAHGQIRRVHGKPVIAQRDVLWGGWIEEDELTERLNSRTPDPFKWHGYSLVLVHCWTKDLAAIRTVVEGLDEHIEVVTPGQLIHLVNRNMAK